MGLSRDSAFGRDLRRGCLGDQVAVGIEDFSFREQHASSGFEDPSRAGDRRTRGSRSEDRHLHLGKRGVLVAWEARRGRTAEQRIGERREDPALEIPGRVAILRRHRPREANFFSRIGGIVGYEPQRLIDRNAHRTLVIDRIPPGASHGGDPIRAHRA